ncbi:hypothetical protein NBE98_09590 [Clostridium swellfunianum]|uniref:hypothetical protein n=1 Tax=Clostridium swellfunianum TaxID=1367462 RepID=UPI00202E7689|nr:hypothetical protein [Clostridium swellfunianum]MCM0648625.1 hypothetical protein [Clostridium swellfunianum]
MATTKNAVYQVDNGTDFDTIYFETKASLVKTNSSSDVETQLADILSQMAVRPIITTSARTYYVNASTGNDNNDGLTAGTAFKTIGKAVGVLPQIINHAIMISVAAGDYVEDVYLNGKVGNGNISIIGAGKTITKVRYIEGNQCTIQLYIKSLATTTNVDTMRFFRCNYVIIEDATNIASLASSAFVIFIASHGILKNSSINYAYVVAQAIDMSNVLVANNTGSGNTYNIMANASTVYKSGTQPSATTAEFLSNGGEVR